MRLLSGDKLAIALGGNCASSKRLRLAVAFWGDGALDALSVNESALPDVSVVCNLRMGGTNPYEIAKLRKAFGKDRVRQHDTLHSKIYLLDIWGVVGSSNLSSNGLAMQGKETAGWREANIAFDWGPLYEAVEQEFATIWKEPRIIRDNELDAAIDVWSDRRRLLPIITPDGKTLLDVLRLDPSALGDHSIYVCAYDRPYDEATRKEVEAQQEKMGFGKDLEAFQDCSQLPREASLICFLVQHGQVIYDGLWRRTPDLPDTTVNRSNIQWCKKLHDIGGIEQVGSIKAWTPIVLEVLKKGGLLEVVPSLASTGTCWSLDLATLSTASHPHRRSFRTVEGS